MDAALNKWYRLCVAWVMGAMGIWEMNGEIAVTNIVAGQAEYVLPVSLIAINRVAIKYPNATQYVYATRLDDLETRDAFENGSISRGSESFPVFREFDNSIFIYPIPTANVTSGISLELTKDITDLVGTNDTPNINPLIHQILTVGAAMDYCDSEEMYSKAARLDRRIFGARGGDGRDGLKYALEELAANHDRSVRNQIRARVRSYR